MTILDTIVAHKKKEVALAKSLLSIDDLKKAVQYNRSTISLSEALLEQASTGIIAEFKRKSPSKGFISEQANVHEITEAYTQNGAAALSVLTDKAFFGARENDFEQARKNSIPILRKDFIIDAYQIHETKAMGADVMLLIAACLTPNEVRQLAKTAIALGLEVILELHDETEVGHICDETSIIGINNRNLKTFKVDIEQSLRMAENIPADKVKIAESGIDNIQTIHLFRQHGFKGFLIGEHFMRQQNTALAFKDFVHQLSIVS